MTHLATSDACELANALLVVDLVFITTLGLPTFQNANIKSDNFES